MMLREARRDEVERILFLIADDKLGARREKFEDLTPYLAAFDAIAADPNNQILVWDEGGQESSNVVGCFQLTFIPGLSRGAAWRAQIESVRVAREKRAQGIGEKMMRGAIDLARARGCKLVQLTTDKTRQDAHRFYKKLGFTDSHEGMKLVL
jgi:ribosomal protein S18 acetylase RimI-like enzyme